MADEERFQYRGVRHLLRFSLPASDATQPNHVVARALRRWWFEHGHRLSCWEGSSYVVVATRLPPELHAHLDEASQLCTPSSTPEGVATTPCFILAVFPLQRKRMYDPFFTPLRPSPSLAHACRLQRMPGSFTWMPDNAPKPRPEHIFAASVTPSSPTLLPVFPRMSDVLSEEAMLLRRLEEVRKTKKQLEEVPGGVKAEIYWHRATALHPPLSCDSEDTRPSVPIYETVTPLQMLLRPLTKASTVDRAPILHVKRNPSWAEVCILLTQHLSRDEAWDLVCDDEETAREWRRWSSVASYMRIHVWGGGGDVASWPASLNAPTLVASITKQTPDAWLPPLHHVSTLVWLDRCDASQTSTEAVQRYWAERLFQREMAQMELRLQERQQRRRKGGKSWRGEMEAGEESEPADAGPSAPAPAPEIQSAPIAQPDASFDVSALDPDFFPELDQILS